MKKYNSLDAGKFFMAVVVVAMHTEPLINCEINYINKIYDALKLVAVPFFFVTAGFLLAKKMKYPYTDSKSLLILKDYIFRMIKLYVIWNMVYCPLAIWSYWKSGRPAWKCCLYYIRGFFLVGQQYNSWMLWYLLSTIYGLSLWYILLKKKCSFEMNIVICIIFALLSWGGDWLVDAKVLLPNYMLVLCKLIQYSIGSGRILRGIYFLAIGMYLAYKPLKFRTGALLMVLGYVGNIVCFQYIFLRGFFTVACTTGLFIVLVGIKLTDSKYYFIMRKISTVIYFIHLFIWTIYYGIRYGEKTYGMDCFIVTLIASILISFIYIYWNKQKKTVGFDSCA